MTGRSTRWCALDAETCQFGVMLDFAEAVFGGDPAAPLRQSAIVQFDNPAAFATDQVMVVTVRAGAVRRLTRRAGDRIDLALLGHATEVAVDGRQADCVIGSAQVFMQLLGAERAVGRAERRKDQPALFGVTDGVVAGRQVGDGGFDWWVWRCGGLAALRLTASSATLPAALLTHAPAC